METPLSFKNSEGIEILQFSNIRKKFEKQFRLIVYKVAIKFDFFSAVTDLDGEEGDFIEMRECLLKGIEGKATSFSFNPIGDQFHLRFEPKDNNEIIINVKLYNPLFSGLLEFKYNTNQAQIHELVKQIEALITS